MARNILWVLALVVLTLGAGACGDGGGGSGDADAEDPAPDDVRDTDTPADTPTDNPADNPADTPQDPQADEAADTVPDEIGPDVEDVLPDGETACERSGGECVTVPVVPDACVVCEGGLIPAPPERAAMGCTSGGPGAEPWCCEVQLPTIENDCELADGECYPPAGDPGTDPCPTGWDLVYTACVEGRVCCMAGEDC